MSDDMALRVHPAFFKEFASKTLTSVGGILSELVENSFDEDATKVVVTVLDSGSIMVEDDAGMSETTVEKFLLVGSPHKQEEQRSPRFNRLRSGKYGTGRLGFLTAFKRMVVKTRRGEFSLSLELNESVLEGLASGKAELKTLNEPALNREGTEIRLLDPKMKVDPTKLARELRKVACLKQPFFELYIRQDSKFTEWSFETAERIESPQVEGLRIPISEHGLDGEVIVSRRPLPEEGKGLAILIGGHAVARSSFGVSSVLADRITGWVRGEGLTARFADKSALIEDDTYEEFSKRVKAFLKEKVTPAMEGYVEVEITREESRVYRQVDQLLSEAVHHVIESVIEVQESVGEAATNTSIAGTTEDDFGSPHPLTLGTSTEKTIVPPELESTPADRFIIQAASREPVKSKEQVEGVDRVAFSVNNGETLQERPNVSDGNYRIVEATTTQAAVATLQLNPVDTVKITPISESLFQPHSFIHLTSKTTRARQVRRTFILKKVGYRVIPYEDEHDEREAFAEEGVIYTNKAHLAYRAEARKGGELLLRHVVRLVSQVIALSRYPEGREALELQNKLIAEVVRLHQQKP